MRNLGMTEFEVVELINGLTSNIIANQALFVTILSAYLVVAYSVGDRLTKYQVAFINFMFVLFSLLGIQTVGGIMDIMTIYALQYTEMRGILSDANTVKVDAVRWGIVGVRLLLCAGALVFMWQVRHPKTE